MADFTMIPIERSSNIAEVGYNPTTRESRILFRNGALYAFYGVPPENHVGLLAAESPGEYFNKHFKSRVGYGPAFAFQRLTQQRRADVKPVPIEDAARLLYEETSAGEMASPHLRPGVEIVDGALVLKVEANIVLPAALRKLAELGWLGHPVKFKQ